jgi:hypothetical protein
MELLKAMQKMMDTNQAKIEANMTAEREEMKTFESTYEV